MKRTVYPCRNLFLLQLSFANLFTSLTFLLLHPLHAVKGMSIERNLAIDQSVIVMKIRHATLGGVLRSLECVEGIPTWRCWMLVDIVDI